MEAFLVIGGVPLGLRNGSSAQIAIVDIAANIVGFEVMNACRVSIRMGAGDHKGLADVVLTAEALSRPVDGMEVTTLASVNVSCLATRLLTLDAALIHTLYLLDGELARRELLPG